MLFADGTDDCILYSMLYTRIVLLKMALKRYRLDGLNSAQYKAVRTNITSTCDIIGDIQLECPFGRKHIMHFFIDPQPITAPNVKIFFNKHWFWGTLAHIYPIQRFRRLVNLRDVRGYISPPSGFTLWTLMRKKFFNLSLVVEFLLSCALDHTESFDSD